LALLTAVRSGIGRRSAIAVLLGLGIAASIAACTRTKVSEAPRARQGQLLPTPGGGGTVPPGETPKVALLLPMSGQYEKLGTAMRQAAEMALFDVAGKKFTLTPIDTQGTAEGARRAAQQAKAAGVHLVLGPLFANSVRAVKEEFEGSGVNIIAFSTDPTVAGDNVFLMGFLVKPQVSRILRYASQQNLKRVAVVAPEGPYGESVIAAVNQAAQSSGVDVVSTLLYPTTDTQEMNKSLRAFTHYDLRARDLLKVLRRTHGKTDLESRRERAKARRETKIPPPEWDAVLVAEGGARLLLVASMLAYYDVDPDKVQYLGTGQWDDTAIAKEPNLKGAWFPAPPPPARAKFEAKYKEQFKSDPPRIATLAYDAVALAAVLARAEGGPDFSRQAITSPNGFAGIDGIFRFLPSGMSERGLAVLEVAEGEFRMIGNAPNTFESPTE
jgi:ABC-type branched-subunit amino acid transport system substrate-binding protein